MTGAVDAGKSREQRMTKDDALRIALNALLGCTYDERMRAIGAVKDALSGGETVAEAPAPAGPARVRNPRMWAVVKANGQVSKLRGTRQAAEKCRDDYNRKFGHVWGEATIAAFTRLER